jgi:hypothetical protein
VGFHLFNPLFNSTFQRSNLNDHNSTFPSHFLSAFISFSNSVIQFEQPHDSIIDSLICFSIFQNPNKFDYSDWNSLQDHLNPFAFGTIFCFSFRINLPIWKTNHHSILHSLISLLIHVSFWFQMGSCSLKFDQFGHLTLI